MIDDSILSSCIMPSSTRAHRKITKDFMGVYAEFMLPAGYIDWIFMDLILDLKLCFECQLYFAYRRPTVYTTRVHYTTAMTRVESAAKPIL